jgi:hypothetical protein
MHDSKNFFRSLVFLAIVLAGLSTARAETLVDTIRAKYGADAFRQVEEIRFTFAARVLGIGPSHTWIWKPKADSVTLVDEGYSYSRKNMNAKAQKLDEKFLNDQNWLFFPLGLGLDKNARIDIDTGFTRSPKNKQDLRHMVVTYGVAGGGSSGDRYDVYVEPDGLIREWTYRKRGSGSGVSWTWEKYVHVGGMLFSLDHRGLAHIKLKDIEVNGPAR